MPLTAHAESAHPSGRRRLLETLHDALAFGIRDGVSDEDSGRVLVEADAHGLVGRITSERPGGHLLWVFRKHRASDVLSYVVTVCPVGDRMPAGLPLGVAVRRVDDAVSPQL